MLNVHFNYWERTSLKKLAYGADNPGSFETIITHGLD
jgi:hypothetical protein